MGGATHVDLFTIIALSPRPLWESGFAYGRHERSELVRIAKAETNTCVGTMSDRLEPEQIQDGARVRGLLSTKESL